MKIYDTCMLNGELDMLECRLRELYDAVERFVVVEAEVTHRGDPKPLHYAENRERFAPWADKIRHVAVGWLPDDPDPWVREHAQRNLALLGLKDAADDDIVLISDVDEFPPPRFLTPDPAYLGRQRLEPDAAVAFRPRVCIYAADWEYPVTELAGVAARVSLVREHGLAAVRDARGRFPQITGGWHLSWLGGPERQRAKLAVHCHTEMPRTQEYLIATGHCYTVGFYPPTQTRLIPVDVDRTWPQWIRERQCPPEWFRPRPSPPS